MEEKDDLARSDLRDFSEKLASKAAVPGGGGASALAGALGVALGSMVIHLTQGKKRYAEVEEEFGRLETSLDALRIRLLDLIQMDANGFLPLSKAYSLPKGTPEEKAHKEEVLERELDIACKVPLMIMHTCADALEAMEIIAEKGNKLALSDAAAGALLLESAMEAASFNIYINAKSLKNRKRADEITDEADGLLIKWKPCARAIADKVLKDLHN